MRLLAAPVWHHARHDRDNASKRNRSSYKLNYILPRRLARRSENMALQRQRVTLDNFISYRTTTCEHLRHRGANLVQVIRRNRSFYCQSMRAIHNRLCICGCTRTHMHMDIATTPTVTAIRSTSTWFHTLDIITTDAFHRSLYIVIRAVAEPAFTIPICRNRQLPLCHLSHKSKPHHRRRHRA